MCFLTNCQVNTIVLHFILFIMLIISIPEFLKILIEYFNVPVIGSQRCNDPKSQWREPSAGIDAQPYSAGIHRVDEYQFLAHISFCLQLADGKVGIFDFDGTGYGFGTQ